MHILIFGATSDVAQELATQYVKKGDEVSLLGIDTVSLQPFQSDLQIRYNGKINLIEFDILKSPDQTLLKLIQNSDISIMLIGYLGDQDKAEQNEDELLRIINLNYSKVIEVINQIQRIYVTKKQGVIAGISSVAGDRGKQSNYAYGSAKAGLSVYLDGLRNRLYPKGVHVVTIKPGFMATKMTQHMSLPKVLTASPQAAAKQIIRAVQTKKNKVYILPVWRYISLVLQMVPDSIFKKLRM
jgi:decaprenylphospho-beta-D-erythro-pentofuranosid-2-ulose 2-reductase